MEHPVVTYEPDNSLKKGIFSLFAEIAGEIVRNRWLIFQLFKRDFFTVYKQSFIGVLWAFIIPIISVGTFIILNQSGVFSMGEIAVPYPVYAILGMAFWQLFAAGLVAGSNSLVKAGSMIVKINFSKKALVFASAGQSLVSFLIQLVLVAVLLFYYGLAPSLHTLLLPVLVIPIMLLTFGIGFIFSLLNGVMRDIGNALSVLLTFLMFLTPVLYARPTTGLLVKVTAYNPLFYLVSGPRELILTGTMTEWRGFAAASAIALVVFTVCLYIFHLTETRVT